MQLAFDFDQLLLPFMEEPMKAKSVLIIVEAGAFSQLVKLRKAWTLLTDEWRERIVKQVQQGAIFVSKGEPTEFSLSGCFNLREEFALQEVAELWGCLREETRADVMRAVSRYRGAA